MAAATPNVTRRTALGIAAFALAGLYGGGLRAQQPRYFRIGTAGTTGTYFQIGGVLANAISAPPGVPNCQRSGPCGVPGLLAIAQATQGSVENVDLIGRGQLDSALIQADIAAWAYHGAGIYADRPVRNLRAIAALFPESVHIVVRRDSPIRSVRDLRGKRVSTGEKESGTLADARIILDAAGVKERSLRLDNTGLGDSATALREGAIDAFFIIGGYPIPAISDLASMMPIRLLPIDDELADKVKKRDPLFSSTTIFGGVYPGVDEATATVAVNAVWVVAAELPDQLVYQIAKSLWNAATQRILALRLSMARRIALPHAIEGLDIPLHPGAERYYRESGMMPQAAQ